VLNSSVAELWLKEEQTGMPPVLHRYSAALRTYTCHYFIQAFWPPKKQCWKKPSTHPAHKLKSGWNDCAWSAAIFQRKVYWLAKAFGAHYPQSSLPGQIFLAAVSEPHIFTSWVLK